MNATAIKLIAAYTTASVVAVAAACLVVSELGSHSAVSLHGNLFG